MKNKAKTLLQETPLLKVTGLYEDDDLVSRRISHQKSQQPQSPHVNHSLLAEIQHHHSDESHLSHHILINIENAQTPEFENDSASFTEISLSIAIIQTPFKSASTNSQPFFDLSFFTLVKHLKISFFPLTIF